MMHEIGKGTDDLLDCAGISCDESGLGRLEVHADQAQLQVEDSLLRLQQSDLEMIRVLEDLIYLLTHKGVVRITDLPGIAQAKLIERSRARDALGGLTSLINDEEQGLI